MILIIEIKVPGNERTGSLTIITNGFNYTGNIKNERTAITDLRITFGTDNDTFIYDEDWKY